MAEAQHLVAVGAQLQWPRRMVIGDEQVTTAFGQLHHRVVHVQRDEPALDRADALAQVLKVSRISQRFHSSRLAT